MINPRMNPVVVLIPAYKPDGKLVELVQQLALSYNVVVVNDGSPETYQPVFEALPGRSQTTRQVDLLIHTVNLGKGAALRTGFQHILEHLPEAQWVITADADGQHTPIDISKIAQAALGRISAGETEPQGVGGVTEKAGSFLVLGSRQFDRDVPPRSMLGNVVTRWVLRIFFGLNVWDTQTGLRAIPHYLLPRIVQIPYNRYEYELEMLLAARRSGANIYEIPIDTIYIENNKSSHFKPLLDSTRIYSILFREQVSALAAGMLDLCIFWVGILLGLPFVFSLGLGRVAAILLNDWLHGKPVFYPPQETRAAARQTALTWLLSGMAAYFLIPDFQANGLDLIQAKLLVEMLLAGVLGMIALVRRRRHP